MLLHRSPPHRGFTKLSVRTSTSPRTVTSLPFSFIAAHHCVCADPPPIFTSPSAVTVGYIAGVTSSLVHISPGKRRMFATPCSARPAPPASSLFLQVLLQKSPTSPRHLCIDVKEMEGDTPGFTDPDKLYKKWVHRRKGSGELDVFEAERYFSGGREAADFHGNTAAFPQKTLRDEMQVSKGGRTSLDIPMIKPVPSQSQLVERKIKDKEYSQPISPGGRLARFLQAFFHKTASKKKKSRSTTQSVKDEEENRGGRSNKWRNSISHVGSVDSKSKYSSSSSGFRTPPPSVKTPTKLYKDLRNHSDHKQVVTLSKYNEQVRSMALQNKVSGEKTNTDLAWLDEKHKLKNGFSEKNINFKDGFSEKDGIWVDQYQSEEKDFRRFNEVDDGEESDSSSDLFELQNYNLGFHDSSGLPVYETTHMDNIKRGAPIANGLQ
ncbi:hypothetical protein HHK36_024426 [Tetracentron sinense]|uniref:Protein BIG GRAIN 1-like E n=1 Tax=Tetracentron sinense TaxID=13715 RepID=A0A835D487_TETSI|nr:hypothetical protein HHK36_024426 [Tetracentron sinense]